MGASLFLLATKRVVSYFSSAGSNRLRPLFLNGKSILDFGPHCIFLVRVFYSVTAPTVVLSCLFFSFLTGINTPPSCMVVSCRDLEQKASSGLMPVITLGLWVRQRITVVNENQSPDSTVALARM